MQPLNFILALTALMAGMPSSMGGQKVDYVVDPWAPPDAWAEGYAAIDVYPGDSITFQWGYGVEYNVWQYPSLSCDDDTDAVWVGATSGAKYTFTEWDGTPEGKETLFVCNLSDYCQQGMNIRVNIHSGAAPSPTSDPWAAPPTQAPSKTPVAPPTYPPTYAETYAPTYPPSYAETYAPTYRPSYLRTNSPTYYPTGGQGGGGDDFDANPTESPTGTLDQEDDQPPPEEAKEILIENWVLGQTFPPIEAKVGDTIKFKINEGHDVFLHPSLTCDDKTGAILVGNFESNSEIPAEYTFQDADAGTEMMFICGVADHCIQGMQMIVTVTANVPEQDPSPTQSPTETFDQEEEDNQPPPEEAEEILIENWVIPQDNQPFPPIEAKVGDTIKFIVNEPHNVFLHPSLTCDDKTDAVLVGDADIPAEYTFQDADAGTKMMFICGVGTHCIQGMQLIVSVTANVPEKDPLDDGILGEIDASFDQEATSGGNGNPAPSASGSAVRSTARTVFAASSLASLVIGGWIL